MNCPPYDPPYGQLLLLGHQNVAMSVPAGAKKNTPWHATQFLHSELAIDPCKYDAAIHWRTGVIDDKQIAVMDAKASHGIA